MAFAKPCLSVGVLRLCHCCGLSLVGFAVVLPTAWWVLCSINAISPFGPTVVEITRLMWSLAGPWSMSTTLVRYLCFYRVVVDNQTVIYIWINSLKMANHEAILGTLKTLLLVNYHPAASLTPACHWTAIAGPPNVLEQPLTNDKNSSDRCKSLTFSQNLCGHRVMCKDVATCQISSFYIWCEWNCTDTHERELIDKNMFTYPEKHRQEFKDD